jgi:predicted  nucleic acid-binding Zn-ribbon protein
MKSNASNLDTALKKSESEKNNIRQKLDSISQDLNAERRNHNTLKKPTQSQWTSQPAVKDLSREFNTYDKRKWSQFASELWKIDQAREQIMHKATKTYQDEYYTHVNIVSTIDMRRGLNLS